MNPSTVPVGIEQLSVSLAALAKLELEAALLVEHLRGLSYSLAPSSDRVHTVHRMTEWSSHLDPVVVRVSDDNVSLSVDGYSRRLSELPLHHSELAKLAVVDHLLTLDLRARRTEGS